MFAVRLYAFRARQDHTFQGVYSVIKHQSLNPASPRRVVVLGGSGFVGSHLCADLRAGGVPTLALSSADLDLASVSASQLLSDCLQEGDALVFAAALTPDKGTNVRTLMRNLAMMESLA